MSERGKETLHTPAERVEARQEREILDRPEILKAIEDKIASLVGGEPRQTVSLEAIVLPGIKPKFATLETASLRPTRLFVQREPRLC